MTKCIQCGRFEAKGDEFCSTRCAKLSTGTVTPEQDKAMHPRRSRRKMVFDNPYVSREAHEGPGLRRGARPNGKNARR